MQIFSILNSPLSPGILDKSYLVCILKIESSSFVVLVSYYFLDDFKKIKEIKCAQSYDSRREEKGDMDMEGNPEHSSNDVSDTSWHASQPELMSPTAGIQSSDTT